MDSLSKKSLVSVIIPTYNSKSFLKETIKSVLKQTYTSIEIILVDDGSTDSTSALFQDYELLGIRCFSIENGGASNARNFGLSKASGDYVQFLDADDLLHPQKIEKQLRGMQNEKAKLSYSKWVNFSCEIKEAALFRFQDIPYTKTRTGKELMKSFGMHNWFIPVFSWLTHINLLKKAGPWNTEVSNNDDGEYFARVLFHSAKVICIDEILGYYRTTDSANSLSKLNSEDKINSAFKSYQLIEKLLQQGDDLYLMSYPKRLYYTQFKMIHKTFPELAKRAAIAFDRLNVDCFLTKEKIWPWIRFFGLHKGMYYFNRYSSLKKRFYRKVFKSKLFS